MLRISVRVPASVSTGLYIFDCFMRLVTKQIISINFLKQKCTDELNEYLIFKTVYYCNQYIGIWGNGTESRTAVI